MSEKKQYIENILSSTSWAKINILIVKKVGWEATGLLSLLVARNAHWRGKKLLKSLRDDKKDPDSIVREYFFCTTEHIERHTFLNYNSQKNSIKALAEAGFIKTQLGGVPPKVHFHICDKAICDYLNYSEPIGEADVEVPLIEEEINFEEY